MRLLSYSPAHSEIAVLERLTTGETRIRLIETLVAAVRAEVGREIHQHQLLIGPRGSGKTHALTLVAHRLRTDPELGSRTLPIALAEEEVASHPADLMHKVLSALDERLPHEKGIERSTLQAAQKVCRTALAALRSETDDERALEIAVGTLDEAATALSRLLVLIVENLDTLLYSGPGLSRRSAAAGQWALRKALLESRGLLLLAAAPSQFGEVSNPQAAFYNFFRLHQLGELAPEEMLDLIRRRLEVELENPELDAAHRHRLDALSASMEARIPKLRGLLTLTGGLPRFAHLIFDLLSETEMTSIVGLLARFLDAQTPYFQSRLDPRMVPEEELEILDLLATSEGPLTPKEIAGRLRAKSSNAVATYLKRLRERGLVRPLGTTRKETRYDLSEPLFRIWRRFRIGRVERDRVVVLAELVAAIFEPTELAADWEALVADPSAALRRRILEAALVRSGWRLVGPESSKVLVEPETADLLVRAHGAAEANSRQQAFELYREAIERMRQRQDRKALARFLGQFAELAYWSGEIKAALAAAEEGEKIASAIQDHLGHALSLFIQGIAKPADSARAALALLCEAEGLFQSAGYEFGRASVIRERGIVHFKLGEKQEGLEAIRKAETIFRALGEPRLAARCVFIYDALVFSESRFDDGLGYLAEAYRIARDAERATAAGAAARELWGWLHAFTARRPEPTQLVPLLLRVGPLIQASNEDEEQLGHLARFALMALYSLSGEPFLEILPTLEGALPEIHSTYLHPFRLAAEIQTGRHSVDLPTEPEEMRRAVQEVLAALARADNKPVVNKSVGKKRGAGTGKARKRRSRLLRA